MSFTVYLDHENGSRSEFYRSHFGQTLESLFLYSGQYTIISNVNSSTQTVYDSGYYTITANGIDPQRSHGPSNNTELVSGTYPELSSGSYISVAPPSEYELMYNDLLIKYNAVVEENKALVNSLFENT